MRSTPLSLALVLPLCGAALAWADRPYYDDKRSLEKQREAAKEAKEQARSAGAKQAGILLNDKSVNVRDDVFRVLEERNDEELLEELGNWLGNRKAPHASAAVAELYGRCKFAAGRKALEKAGLRARDELTVLESIWALERIGSKESGKALEKAHKKRSTFRVQGDALIALATLDPKRAEEHIPDALEDKVLPLRIAALEALARIDRERAVAAAVKAIAAEPLKRDNGWEAKILFAALDTLEGWYERAGAAKLFAQAVDALIARLGRADGLSQYRCGMTLADLTGETLGDDPEIWKGWWEPRREGFAPKDKARPQPETKKKKKKKGKKGEDDKLPGEKKEGEGRVETGGGAKTRVRFHGIPIHSNRLLFAQDVSGGMKNPMDRDASDSPTKMAFAVAELKRVLKALDDDVWTNVCFFATDFAFTSKSLFPIKKARRQLLQFVDTKAVTPDGYGQSRSNLYDTLATALEDPSIDTIFFLSEGGPTEGQFLRTTRFMRHLQRQNVYARVQVHCLQVTTSSFGEKFLRRLSEETGGRFYDMEFLQKAHGKK